MMMLVTATVVIAVPVFGSHGLFSVALCVHYKWRFRGCGMEMAGARAGHPPNLGKDQLLHTFLYRTYDVPYDHYSTLLHRTACFRLRRCWPAISIHGSRQHFAFVVHAKGCSSMCKGDAEIPFWRPS